MFPMGPVVEEPRAASAGGVSFTLSQILYFTIWRGLGEFYLNIPLYNLGGEQLSSGPFSLPSLTFQIAPFRGYLMTIFMSYFSLLDSSLGPPPRVDPRGRPASLDRPRPTANPRQVIANSKLYNSIIELPQLLRICSDFSDRLVVKQKLQTCEILTGCEQENRFKTYLFDKFLC